MAIRRKCTVACALLALPSLFVFSSIGPYAFAADGEYQLEGLRVTSVGKTGPTSMRVDLVVVGDGYIREDYRPGGKWEIDTARLVKNFFEKRPFKTHRTLFNVHLVEAFLENYGKTRSARKAKKILEGL